MKVTSKQSTSFQPITLELVIESKEELAHLWACFNCSPAVIRGNGARDRPKIKELSEALTTDEDDDCTLKLFREVDQHARAAGLL